MKGDVLAFISVTLVDNTTLLGRALARNGALDLGNVQIMMSYVISYRTHSRALSLLRKTSCSTLKS
jgi:hypothetical protein